MSCFSCFGSRRKDVSRVEIDNGSGKGKAYADFGEDESKEGSLEATGKSGNSSTSSAARSLAFRELATATRGFKEVNLIGEGDFGRVYKGLLETGQIVAIKQLNHDGHQGFQEFVVGFLC